MLKNHLRIAFRTLRKRTGYTLINVGGLGLGITVCLLMGLYVQEELRYDRFHEKADRIAMLAKDDDGHLSMSTPYPLADALEANVAGVTRAVRTGYAHAVDVQRPGTGQESERRVLLADAGFFDMFSFPAVAGDPSTALDTPEGAVLTRSLATDLFGEANPVGQALAFEGRDTTYQVTVKGVVEDVPTTSTIQFDLVASLNLRNASQRQPDSWGARMYLTYVEMGHPVDAVALGKQATQALLPLAGEDRASYAAIALPDYYLSDQSITDGFRGQRRYVYIFGAVALFILLIACINYVNLAMARSLERAKEVGVRKSVGASRQQLVGQFLGEALLLSGAALLVALALMTLLLPAFNTLFGTKLSVSWETHGLVLLLLSVLTVAVGVAAGLYPALVLSRYQPSRVLRGSGATMAAGGGWLRRVLVVTQFAASAALIVATLIIYQQLGYMQTKNLGFNGSQVVVIDLPTAEMQQRSEVIRQEVEAHTGIQQVSLTNAIPGRFYGEIGYSMNQVTAEAPTEAATFSFNPGTIDRAYVATLGMEFLAGHDFAYDAAGVPIERGYLFNETAARTLGWTPEEAVGKEINLLGADAAPLPILGVLRDFHVRSLHDAIIPVVLMPADFYAYSMPPSVVARLAPDQMRSAMDHLEQVMATHAPGEPFAYTFLDETFDAMYRAEERLSQIFTTFAALAILVACFGLFGLTALTTERRTKEIGIRKVLGATVGHLILLLSREFAALVVAALALGIPVAYLLMQRWLADFAYRVEISPTIFLYAALAALGIALVTVSYHAIRAALADPVKSLRYE